MEKIIKKAIEGGYKPEEYRERKLLHNVKKTWNRYTSASISEAEILLDPIFWQALGKAEGWKGNGWNKKPLWQNEWHSFIDHLAEGKDIDSFFNDLLTN